MGISMMGMLKKYASGVLVAWSTHRIDLYASCSSLPAASLDKAF
jgi:hypothetical protein